jgi:hypothetical protein
MADGFPTLSGRVRHGKRTDEIRTPTEVVMSSPGTQTYALDEEASFRPCAHGQRMTTGR